jgi:hypothetical protein
MRPTIPALAIVLAQAAQPGTNSKSQKWCFERGQRTQLCEATEDTCNRLRELNTEIAMSACKRVEPPEIASTLLAIEAAFGRAGVMFLDVGDARSGGYGVRLELRAFRRRPERKCLPRASCQTSNKMQGAHKALCLSRLQSHHASKDRRSTVA